MSPTLTPAAFAAKWRGVTTIEKAASHERFFDLCLMVGEPTPHEADPTDEQRARVREAARRFAELRDGWLNPPNLAPADLETRTLTNLYNQRPTWLAIAHADLDEAVVAAFGWPAELADAWLLERLLALTLGASSTGHAGPPEDRERSSIEGPS